MDFLEIFKELQTIWHKKYGDTIVTNCPNCKKAGIYPAMYDGFTWRRMVYKIKGSNAFLWEKKDRIQVKNSNDFFSHKCLCYECKYLNEFIYFVNFNAGELTTIYQFFQEEMGGKKRNWDEGQTVNLIEEIPDWATVEKNVKRRTHDNLNKVFG